MCSRSVDGGRGLDGDRATNQAYFNPVGELMLERAHMREVDLRARATLRRPSRRRARADELHAARAVLARRAPRGARTGARGWASRSPRSSTSRS